MTFPGDRLDSLDAFRGLTIASMIVVNNPGAWESVYAPLQHAAWNNVTFADFVFPFFVFIMGVAMPFAFGRRLERGRGSRRRHWRIGIRVVVLLALGLALNAIAGFGSPENLRVPGVLQRIALVYLLTAMLVLHTETATRAVVAGSLLLVHWAVLTIVPFGGHPGGAVSPQQNVSAFIDAGLFGSHRLMPLDPEGALGTISATSLALLGVFAGQWLRAAGSNRRRVAGLALGGLVLLGVGLAWSYALPLNKPLWTGSFTLVTAGAASLALVACYLSVDVGPLGIWARPFVWLGVNSLAIYSLSELAGHLMDQSWVRIGSGHTTARTWMFWHLLLPWLGASVSAAGLSLLFAVAFTTLWIAAAGVLYNQGIRIRA